MAGYRLWGCKRERTCRWPSAPTGGKGRTRRGSRAPRPSRGRATSGPESGPPQTPRWNVPDRCPQPVRYSHLRRAVIIDVESIIRNMGGCERCIKGRSEWLQSGSILGQKSSGRV
eukprot:1187999-Prorocentrum_minimum.AAC.2